MKPFETGFIVICFLLVHAINTEIPKDVHEKYNKSHKQWQNIKKLWKNSYQYTFGRDLWTPFKTRTTIFVLNGEVVKRERIVTERYTTLKHWVENKTQLYSHDTLEEETKPGTFDNVYSSCLRWLNVSSPDSNQKYLLTFEADTANHGLMKSCGHRLALCMDNCFFGLSSIENLKPYQDGQLSNSTVSTASRTNKFNKDKKIKRPKKVKNVKKINNDEKVKND